MDTGYYIVGALVALWITGNVSRRIRRRGKIIRVADDNCTACGKCMKRCRRNVFEMIKSDKGAHLIVKNPENCTACGDCMSACEFNALEIVKLQKK